MPATLVNRVSESGSFTGSHSGTIDFAQVASESLTTTPTGTFTGSFSGAFEGIISGSIESASYAETSSYSDSALNSVAAQTSSYMDGDIYVSGGTVIATVAPTIIGLNNELGSYTSINDIGEEVEELGGGLNRTKIDLANYTSCRIIAVINNPTKLGTDGPQMAPQWSLDEVNWYFFASQSINPPEQPAAYMTESITSVSPMVAIKSESKTDVYIRVVTFSGSTSTPASRARVGTVNLFFG